MTRLTRDELVERVNFLEDTLEEAQAEVDRLRAENEQYRIGHVPGPVLQALREENDRLRNYHGTDCPLKAEVEWLRATLKRIRDWPDNAHNRCRAKIQRIASQALSRQTGERG